MDRIWLWLYYSKIPVYPIFYLLKMDNRVYGSGFGVWGLDFLITLLERYLGIVKRSRGLKKLCVALYKVSTFTGNPEPLNPKPRNPKPLNPQTLNPINPVSLTLTPGLALAMHAATEQRQVLKTLKV